MDEFYRGINLGGWLSQYGTKGDDHRASFITERDIAQIASWGLDHVRLPVDYQVLEADDAPGVPLEQGYAYIDACLDWCAKHGLSVMLDLHEAPGFTFNNALDDATRERDLLFTSPELQDRFVALWETMATRYASAPCPVAFELLNEVTLPTNDLWNPLAARAHATIRGAAPHSTIVIGGTHNNAVRGLENLVLIDDPLLTYTFHTYEPLLFTHQMAPWARDAVAWGGRPEYPGELDGLGEFLEQNPRYAPAYADVVGRRLDRDYLEEIIAPAVAFRAATGKPLYCGEFGVADWIDPASRRRWLRDLLAILDEHHIGRALWSYKQMDFGVVNEAGEIIDDAYADVLRGLS